MELRIVLMPVAYFGAAIIVADLGIPDAMDGLYQVFTLREDLQTHRFLCLHTLLHTVSTYAI